MRGYWKNTGGGGGEHRPLIRHIWESALSYTYSSGASTYGYRTTLAIRPSGVSYRLVLPEGFENYAGGSCYYYDIPCVAPGQPSYSNAALANRGNIVYNGDSRTERSGNGEFDGIAAGFECRIFLSPVEGEAEYYSKLFYETLRLPVVSWGSGGSNTWKMNKRYTAQGASSSGAASLRCRDLEWNEFEEVDFFSAVEALNITLYQGRGEAFWNESTNTNLYIVAMESDNISEMLYIGEDTFGEVRKGIANIPLNTHIPIGNDEIIAAEEAFWLVNTQGSNGNPWALPPSLDSSLRGVMLAHPCWGLASSTFVLNSYSGFRYYKDGRVSRP